MNEQHAKEFGKIIAKCWSDDVFKQTLLADPVATLKAEGVTLPAGITVKALENTEQTFHLVIPAKPTALSDEQLDSVAGGLCWYGGCYRW
ncbi:NHLP leader peptide family RiPP precursor [Trinickia sp. YCB016]